MTERADAVWQQAALSELAGQLQAARAEIDQLQTAVRSHRRIGTAVGIIMATVKITDAAAFQLLREVSQTTNRKLRDVAEDVIATGLVPVPRQRSTMHGRRVLSRTTSLTSSVPM